MTRTYRTRVAHKGDKDYIALLLREGWIAVTPQESESSVRVFIKNW